MDMSKDNYYFGGKKIINKPVTNTSTNTNQGIIFKPKTDLKKYNPDQLVSQPQTGIDLHDNPILSNAIQNASDSGGSSGGGGSSSGDSSQSQNPSSDTSNAVKDFMFSWKGGLVLAGIVGLIILVKKV